MGEAVRYDGGDCFQQLDSSAKALIRSWQQQGVLLPLCPEVAGGLAVPRSAAEIQQLKVKTAAGIDVTAAFEAGAERALKLCLDHGITLALLKQGSPSCGNSLINDGTFTKRKISGQGFTAGLLMQRNIEVFNETQLSALSERLQKI